MAYGILRVRNLHLSQIRSCERHNKRLFDPGQTPENIDTERSWQNLRWTAGDRDSIIDALQARLEGVPLRKNSVVAIEFVMGASAEYFNNSNYSASGFLSNCQTFLTEKFGWDNVIAMDQHFDESNPHVHVLIAPVKEKEVKWKNKQGSGTKLEKRLVAREITGGPHKLRQLQDEFFRFIEPYGENFGVKFFRGTRAEEQLRTYSERTDHRFASIERTLQPG